MHVALVSPAWPLKQYANGIVTYVHWMREALRDMGHRVSVFTGGPAELEEGVFLVSPSPWYRARVRLRGWKCEAGSSVFHFGAAYAEAIAAVHRSDRIDVIEMEESFGWSAEVARRTSIPTVVKLHGPAFMSLVEEELESTLAVAKIKREGEALRRARVVTSPARRTLQETIAYYNLDLPISRHVVNPLKLPLSAPLWSLRQCDRKALLFVGRFDKRKGADILLRAFSHLLVADPSLRLDFVGPDTGIPGANGEMIHLEQMKSALFSAEMAARVVFHGKLSPSEIYILRARSFATVIASRWENQGYTALEAMLQGCPLVSSDTGGQGEIIEHGVSGLLAKTGSIEDLAAKIKMLLDNPDWAETLGRGAREYVMRCH